MQIDITQFHQVFFDEVAEHLGVIERVLLSLDPAQPQREHLDEIFRAVHSIKGASATFGFPDLARVSHVLESLLGSVREGRLALRRELVDAVLQANDLFKVLLADARQYRPSDPTAIEAVCVTLTQLATDSQSPAVPQQVDEPYGFFDDPAPAPAPAPEPAPVVQGGEPVRPVPPPATPAQSALPPIEASSIRVGVERVDHMVNLVGELVITQSMLTEAGAGLDPAVHHRLHRALEQLQRNTRDLQELVMTIRMLPVSFVFNRIPRLVRDLAARLEKQVTLEMLGEHTELDRSVIERIGDPLIHIVRNSIDHGIEPPAVRMAQGKDPSGTVRLIARQQGGSIAIEVTDDGAGLQRDRILAKAREQGLQVADDLSDDEVWQLIFLPGFTTAAEVTDVSGRGVGMDVVRRNIQEIGGHVEVVSQPGLGARFTIRLPLTLAILDGMVVAVDGNAYIVPLSAILESIQPAPGQLFTVAGALQVVAVRGEYVPVIPLGQALGGPPGPNGSSILVLVEVDGERAALGVDNLVGDQQVVVKSLETNYRKVNGLSGATIMGDGRVALIVDVVQVVRQARREARRNGKSYGSDRVEA
ncbi:chemotaxis protein CheW [Chitiniphilus purpureus]|uniref:Chemotaxis protein CheA n=1 Tax=Chitiniphilus purpureus TaxID=2981137 RepID=A0ABY6DHX5_9NEIS|nr:chemotaxis protein CheW [Chitiniphilus sp. CD1]UXY13950.1 chemotaxis protein CheW [Chitiniphilus sp. CD1]